MKRFIVLTLFVALIAAFFQASPADAAGKKIRVAVFDFQNNSSWTYWGDNLGKAAGDEFVTQLVNSGQFTVIERDKIAAVLAEQGLGASGAVTASTAPKIGKILGAQILFTGSITAFSIKRSGGTIAGFGATFAKAESKLDVRMIDTTTSEILLAASGAGNKKMGGAAFQGVSFEQVLAKAPSLANLAPVAGSGKVVDVKGPKIYIDGGQEGGVNVGDVYSVYRVTDEIKDEDGNVLDTVTTKTGEIVVTQVLSKSAICESKSGSAKKGDSYRKD
jgi:curli biogenesis system outer membrane secretion channel CsgG